MTLRTALRVLPGLCAVAWAPTALAQVDASVLDDPPATEAATPVDTQYMRVVETPGESLALEVAAWKFVPREGDGPTIALVGVAHIGEASLYRNLQTLLGKFDVVLYESVKPEGAGTPHGDTDAERIAATQSSMHFIARMIELYEDSIDAYPASADDLFVGLDTVDPRLAEWAELAMTDAWQNPITFQRFADGAAYKLVSLGADGEPGGEGAAADIVVDANDGIGEYPDPSEDNLQAKLARALSLEFQLDAMDYSADNWRCSDMTMDQLNRAFAARGLDFVEFGGTLAGAGLPAKMVNGLLRVIEMLDRFVDGMVSDAMKVTMIDILGDQTLTEEALNNELGEGFGEVIIGERNQVVMDDLKTLLEEQPDVNSIAIFYGAAHMPDFERRLAEQFDYVPEDAVWIPAMKVSYDDSAMQEETIQQLRGTIRGMLDAMR